MRGKEQSGSLPELGTASERDERETGARQRNMTAPVLKSPPPQAAQSEVAGYIEVLVAEMRHMAHAAHLESLAYFLEMARLEAAIQARALTGCGTERTG